MKLKKISNTDTFEISGTLIISDFKEAGILKSDGSNYQLLYQFSPPLTLFNKVLNNHVPLKIFNYVFILFLKLIFVNRIYRICSNVI